MRNPGPKEIHVWTVRLGACGPVVMELEKLLTVDELQRAARFRLDHLRLLRWPYRASLLRCLSWLRARGTLWFPQASLRRHFSDPHVIAIITIYY